MDSSSSGPSCSYRSSQSRASVIRENRVVNENQGRPSEPAGLPAPGEQGPGRELRTEFRGLVSQRQT